MKLGQTETKQCRKNKINKVPEGLSNQGSRKSGHITAKVYDILPGGQGKTRFRNKMSRDFRKEHLCIN